MYPAGEKKPHVEKAMLHLQGLRANNVTVAYKTLSDLMTACWLANNVEDAEVIFEDMKNAKYKIHPKVWELWISRSTFHCNVFLCESATESHCVDESIFWIMNVRMEASIEAAIQTLIDVKP